MWFSVQLECKACYFNWPELIKKEHRGHDFDCIKCGEIGTVQERLTAPNLIGAGTRDGVPTGAFIDGQRAKTEEWKKMKEATKLEIESYEMPYKKRKQINKEINKLKEIKK